jgi:hypothetical protein
VNICLQFVGPEKKFLFGFDAPSLDVVFLAFERPLMLLEAQLYFADGAL